MSAAQCSTTAKPELSAASAWWWMMSVRGKDRREDTMRSATEASGVSIHTRVTLAVSGLGPNGTGVLALEQAFLQHPGVHYVYVCAATEMAYVVYDPAQVQPEQLVSIVERTGFHAERPQPR